MKFSLAFETKEYGYALPVPVQKATLTKNQFLTVTVFDDSIPVTTITFSALPDFHQYTLRQYQFLLETFFNEHELQFESIAFDQMFFNMAPKKNFIDGELLWILESVLFALLEKKRHDLFLNLFGKRIKINGLYSGTLDETIACLKIKIRPDEQNQKDTLSLLNRLKENRPDTLFRLDGNRSFSRTDLLTYLQPFSEFKIQYLEEPCARYDEMLDIYRRTGLKIALDESVTYFLNGPEKPPRSFYFVLKPSLLGISSTFRLMKVRPYTVISSSFETRSAMRPLQFLVLQNPA